MKQGDTVLTSDLVSDTFTSEMIHFSCSNSQPDLAHCLHLAVLAGFHVKGPEGSFATRRENQHSYSAVGRVTQNPTTLHSFVIVTPKGAP